MKPSSIFVLLPLLIIACNGSDPSDGLGAPSEPTTPAGCEAYDGCRGKVPSTWCSYPGGHMIPSLAPAAIWNFFAPL
jgi:hypothetical protein